MKFWVNLSLFKFWNTIKERSARVVSGRYINAAVGQIENKVVRKYSGITWKKPWRSLVAVDYRNNLQCHPKEAELEEEWGGPEAFKLITFIKDNFDEVLKSNSSVLVFFSANWCPHCLKLRKPYGMAAIMAKEANLSVTFATFDVNYNPDLADEKGVIGIPLIKYYKNEKFVENYKGKRTALDLFNFAKNLPEPKEDIKQPDV